MLMPFMNDKIKSEVKKILTNVAAPVKLALFTQGQDALVECEFCAHTRELVEEIAELSDQLSVEIHDFVADSAAVKQYQIDKIPAIAIVGKQDYGVRYFGLPTGYEFGTLVQAIVNVSKGESGLTPPTQAALAKINQPVHIQVFVTPTCPYCPQVVLLAYQLAIENAHITADGVEATEFPHLANKYNVLGVPLSVINETIRVEGAASEQALIARLMESLK
jgi:glutaredoxin-like protein